MRLDHRQQSARRRRPGGAAGELAIVAFDHPYARAIPVERSRQRFDQALRGLLDRAPFREDLRHREPRRPQPVRFTFFGDVAKDQDDAEDRAVLVADRGGAVVDAALAPVAGDQDRVVGETLDASFREGAQRRVFRRPAGLFVEDDEDVADGPALGLFQGPARELLGRWIEEHDPGVRVGGHHGVADAGEGDLPPLLAPEHRRFRGLEAEKPRLHDSRRCPRSGRSTLLAPGTG